MIPKLKKGKLSDLGWSAKLPANERLPALNKSVRKYGYASTIQSLNAIAVLNKRTNKEVAWVAKSDMEYLRMRRDGKIPRFR